MLTFKVQPKYAEKIYIKLHRYFPGKGIIKNNTRNPSNTFNMKIKGTARNLLKIFI